MPPDRPPSAHHLHSAVQYGLVVLEIAVSLQNFYTHGPQIPVALYGEKVPAVGAERMHCGDVDAFWRGIVDVYCALAAQP